MTDTEKRRVELLRQTRAVYSEKMGTPAVHPRYRSTYSTLYPALEADEKNGKSGTLGIRTFIAVLLFALFVTADYQGLSYESVDSAKIVYEIERGILPR